MNFQDLKTVEKADFYLDVAFKQANNRASVLRSSLKSHNRLEKSKRIELARIEKINGVLIKHMDNIIKSFPNIDNLAEFYIELVKITLEYSELKKSLGAVNWAKKTIADIFRKYHSKIRGTRDYQRVSGVRKEFSGRISSVMKQINKNLTFLEECRKIMKSYPAVKTGMFTVAIAGFPNVGKTTLLTKLTSSKAEIREYAFTTKTLNLGYFEQDFQKIQFIDTPGTLNRFNKMNDIEKMAYLAIKYQTDVIVYIFDLTETYPIEEQKQLLKTLEDFDKPIIIYLSKTDIVDKKVLATFRKSVKNTIVDIAVLKKKIIKESEED